MFFQAILRCSFSAAERERRRRGKAAGHHFICKVIIWVKWNIFQKKKKTLLSEFCKKCVKGCPNSDCFISPECLVHY